jgi:fibro-slime domain-containing protein
MRLHHFAAAAAATIAFALAAGAASAQSLNVTYFSHGTDSDFGAGECCSVSSNLVLSTLGPDGLPIYNTAADNAGFVIHDLTGTSGNEINWWVNQTGTGTVSLPIANNHMYLLNGTGSNDSNGYLTAIFTGTLNLSTAEALTFNLGSDDDAFVYIDGKLVDSVGGVHPLADAPVTTSTLTQGDHSFELFYADRDQTQAELDFSIDTPGVTLTGGVPEPGTWALMLMGVGAVGWALRRRRQGVATAIA